MPAALKFGFTPFARPRGVLVVFCEENLKFGPATQRTLAPLGDLIRRAAAADRFTGKEGSSLDIVAPTGLNVPRVVVIGVGKESELKPRDIVKLGGMAMGKVPSSAPTATIFAEFGSGPLKANQVAELALGARLRAYRFDLYKTRRKDDDTRAGQDRGQFRLCRARSGRKSLGEILGDRRKRRVRARSRQRAGQCALSRRIRSPRERAVEARSSLSKCSTCRPCASSAWARSLASAKAPFMNRGLSSCAGTAASAASSRWPSSAKACASTPAAFRSSRRRAWKT